MAFDLIPLAVGLLSGAAGGNVAGKLANSSMGTMGRSLTGIVGGTGLAALAPMIPGLEGLLASPADGSMSLSSVMGAVVAGGLGGIILTFILGKVMGNKS